MMEPWGGGGERVSIGGAGGTHLFGEVVLQLRHKQDQHDDATDDGHCTHKHTKVNRDSQCFQPSNTS